MVWVADRYAESIVAHPKSASAEAMLVTAVEKREILLASYICVWLDVKVWGEIEPSTKNFQH
jgi:hypothetical protein